MKKIDKTVFLTVVLGIIGVAVLGDIVSYQISGWNSLITGPLVKGEAVGVSFSIIVGLLLNIPIVMLIMRLLGKDRTIKNLAPVLNLGVMFVIFVFMVVQAALKDVWQAREFALTLVQLGVLFVILDLCDFKRLIKKVQEEPAQPVKAEPVDEEVAEVKEETKVEEPEATEPEKTENE